MPSVGILLVEDHAPLRRFLCAAIRRRSDLEIVGEAVDGIDGVLQARTLQPDLILLDVGLPRLDGISAAERIRRAAPASTLLFVSDHASTDVVRAAFRAGARGYIHKPRLERDLAPAIAAVLNGHYFVSRGLEHGQGTTTLARHDVQFYSDHAGFFELAIQRLGPAVSAGRGVIVVATRSHCDGLAHRMKSAGIDVDAAIQRGTYCPLDARDTLAGNPMQGLPDRHRRCHTFSDLIRSVADGTQTEESRVAIFGECAALLCAAGRLDDAIGLERATNEFLVTHDVDIVCTYPLDCCPPHEEGFRRICAEHGGVDVH